MFSLAGQLPTKLRVDAARFIPEAKVSSRLLKAPLAFQNFRRRPLQKHLSFAMHSELLQHSVPSFKSKPPNLGSWWPQAVLMPHPDLQSAGRCRRAPARRARNRPRAVSGPFTISRASCIAALCLRGALPPKASTRKESQHSAIQPCGVGALHVHEACVMLWEHGGSTPEEFSSMKTPPCQGEARKKASDDSVTLETCCSASPNG